MRYKKTQSSWVEEHSDGCEIQENTELLVVRAAGCEIQENTEQLGVRASGFTRKNTEQLGVRYKKTQSSWV